MTASAHPRHRVSVAVAHAHTELHAVVDASMWSMDSAEAAAALVEVVRLEARVAELKHRVAAHADDLHVGEDTGAASTAAWLAGETRQTQVDARRAVAFGHDLERHALTRDALSVGDLVLEQARAIVHAVDDLPDDLDADLVVKAEAHLLALAAHHNAKDLRLLGLRLFHVIAPDLADAHEADLLEKEEARAAQTSRLTMSDDGHGQVHGRFILPTVQGAMLKKLLLALAAPKHVASTEGPGVERRPSPQRMGRAFMELIERIPAKKLPKVGGSDATILVMIDLDTLTGRLGKAGVLDTGERLSARAVRRLACTARIIPVVLGAGSEILDFGRARRLFSKAQQTAMALRDGGCLAEGCDWPPWMCHAHHWKRWIDGGLTDLADGGLLCPHHHARVHDPRFEMTRLSDGAVSFRRTSAYAAN